MTASTPVRRPLVLAAILAALFMIAIEATIVSTAMPRIAGQLGDLHLYAWVFSAFLLSQTAMTVVFGKLADLYGRKPSLLAGVAVFLAGTTLCGFAWSMPALIAFRLVQGIGAGAIQPICMTLVADMYPGQQRARVQGWLSSVWGISSILGPLAGGVIVAHLHWAWLFWLNVPVGLLAMAGFALFLREQVEPASRRVDVAGAALFTTAIAALMVGLTVAGDPGPTAAAAAVFVASTALFAVLELRAPDPVVSFALWGRRAVATTNGATLFSGMALIGVTAFLPMFVQGVLGRSALVAGFTVTVMVLGWPIGSMIAARNFARFGQRPLVLFGAMLLPVGAALLVLLGPASSPVLAGAGSMVMGLGMGFLSVSALVLIQDSVGWAQRGSATAANIFSRNLGSTLGAAVLGAVTNLALARSGTDPDRIRTLLDQAGPAVDQAGRLALAHALHLTFWGVLALAAITTVLAKLVPRAPPRPAKN